MLDTNITHPPQTACSIPMFAHIPDRAPMYAVLVAAALLTVLASIGLLTEWFSVRQILLVATLLLLTMTQLVVWGCHRHR